MPYCPHCGQKVADDQPAYRYCSSCGRALFASPAQNSAPPTAQLPPFGTGSEFESRKGLENLKSSFLIYLIAGALSLVPLIGTFGGILSIVALIFLILGWRALGRSAFSGAPDYGSSGRWLIRAIIICIIVVIAGVIVSTVWLISNLISSGSLSSGPTPISQAVFAPLMRRLITAIFAIIGVAELVWATAWVKMCFSLRKLSRELSQPRLGTSGVLLIAQVLVSLASGFLLVLTFPNLLAEPHPAAATTTSTGPFLFGWVSLLVAGGILALAGVASIVAEALEVVAAYMGYQGVKGALAVLDLRATTPPRPPPPPSPHPP